MAYYSPEQKAAITPAIKELCKKYGVRATLSVRGNNEIRLVIASGAIDFVGTANEITEHRCSVRGEAFHANTGYIQVNTFHIDTNFKGIAAEFLKEAFAIMNAGNYDRSESQSDYFDVGFYVSIHVGRWNKNYELKAA